MLTNALRRFRHRFTEPSFDRRRSFAGSLIYSCRQTGEDYTLIPAGGRGYYVAADGGRFLGVAAGHSEAVELFEADARDAIRSLPAAA